MTNLVSIIVPIFNKKEYIERCVNSLIEQTYPCIEIILVDDGSSDESYTICHNFEQKDDRIKAYHKKWGGVSSARNYGISKAQGNWITFVDADDYVEPNFIKDLLKNAQDTDLAVCSCYIISNKSRIKESHLFGNKLFVGKQAIFDEILIPLITCDEKLFILLPCVWNKLYKRKIIEDCKIKFDTNLSFAEDYLFNVRYFKECSKVIFCDTPLYNYDCTRPQSVSFSKNTNYKEKINVSYYVHSLIGELFPEVGKVMLSYVMMLNYKKYLRGHARYNGINGFVSLGSYIFHMETFINIANSGTLSDLFVILRRKNCYYGFICCSYLYCLNNFCKYYISKLINR